MKIEDTISAFDKNALEYDDWFARHNTIYQSELLAVQQSVPQNKTGIEIGVGTGRFAQPLNIKFGVEPSDNMAQLAEKRGIKVYRTTGEDLLIGDETFDFALMVTTICFLSDIPKAFNEVRRILITGGQIILGIIDKNSSLGRKYQKEKSKNKFYQGAHFHSTEEIAQLLGQAGFHSFSYWQTLTANVDNKVEQPQPGFGKGSFVVINAVK